MTPRTRPRVRALVSAGGLGLALLLAGCGPSDPEPQEQDEPSNTMPQPEVEDDDSVRLPLAFVTPDGQAELAPLDGEEALQEEQAPGSPAEETGETQPTQEIEIARTARFGCGDTVSVVRSVPMVTEDPAVAALEFLVDDRQSSHGSPAFYNALAASDELSVDSVEVEDDTVLVALGGEPVTTGECESWQILAQIETTARVATGASDSEVTVDGQPLAEVLGLPADREALQISQVQH
ncbi:hypothetical protein [Nesterenkonia sp. CF4.4]|uniref:hypothetical protein n=1 Tax=Nesterenkonia sp. CF4.4 TaxID=3373079 RepID=UPI003EE79409